MRSRSINFISTTSRKNIKPPNSTSSPARLMSNQEQDVLDAYEAHLKMFLRCLNVELKD
jgi:hypothetical protein